RVRGPSRVGRKASPMPSSPRWRCARIRTRHPPTSAREPRATRASGGALGTAPDPWYDPGIMKVCIFFDGQNFYRSLLRYDETLRVDYDRLAVWITQKIGGEAAVFGG